MQLFLGQASNFKHRPVKRVWNAHTTKWNKVKICK